MALPLPKVKLQKSPIRLLLENPPLFTVPWPEAHLRHHSSLQFMVLHEYGLAHHRCTSVRMHSALVVLRGCEDLSMPILSAPGQIEC